MKENLLIAYFSRSGNNYVAGNIIDLAIGNTEVTAKKIQEITGGTLYKIDPIKSYSSDYQICAEESRAEFRSNSRPELVEKLEQIDDFETIILCYPNWLGTMLMPVWTFLEQFDFTGKTILPVCTHEGSGMGRSETDINKLCSGAIIKKELAIVGSTVHKVDKVLQFWLKNQID